MLSKNQFWTAIKGHMGSQQKQQWFMLALVGAVFPIFEGVLTNAWSSASGEAKAPALTALWVVGLIHVALFIFTLVSQATVPIRLLADATEVKEDAEGTTRELSRRKTTYRLLRQTFDALNSQTCVIADSPNEPGWCSGGFKLSVEPLVQVLAENREVALNIRSIRYSIEIYYAHGFVPRTPQEQWQAGNPLRLESLTSPTTPEVIDPTSNRSPAHLGFGVAKAYRQKIGDLRQLFLDGEKRRSDVYFNRFLACPIAMACGPEPVGILIVTADQEEEFAPDAEDTLTFFCSMIANLAFRYTECVTTRDQLRTQQMAGNLRVTLPINLRDPRLGTAPKPSGAQPSHSQVPVPKAATPLASQGG